MIKNTLSFEYLPQLSLKKLKNQKKCNFAKVSNFKRQPMLIKNQFINVNNINIHCKLYIPNTLLKSKAWIIMLHQGLGSIAQWKNFPDKLFKNINLPILLYERTGYGETGTINNILPDNFLFYEAYEILPKIISHFKLNNFYLFGHSDGATISLLYASTKPKGLIGITALTPHVYVEEITKQGILKLINDYDKGILKYFLQKYHHEKTDILFRRWTKLWLSEPLINWNMFNELKKIEVPVITIQGTNDEFGTTKQLEYIAKLCPSQTTHYIIENGQHNPHLEYSSIVIEKTKKAVSIATHS
jgi:pimeloyl-ACP methyl ester carboxylesterase